MMTAIAQRTRALPQLDASSCARCRQPLEPDSGPVRRLSAPRHCPSCRVPLAAAVFLKRRATRVGPLRFGHVSWAFQLRPPEGSADPLWCVGSVDNSAGIPICRPGTSEFWCALVPDPCELMLGRGYSEYKLLPVVDASPEGAIRAQRLVRSQPYVLLGRNCVTGAKQVLRAFGAALPSTRRHIIPTSWFDQIVSEATALR